MTRPGPEPVEGHDVPGMHIWGWMSPDELAWLHQIAATMGSVAEVGALRGRSSYALLSGCEGTVYCIDPWNDPAGESHPAFMENCGHFDNLVAVQGLSPSAAAQVPAVDMVFLDGAHEADQVAADIEAWLPKTVKLICGHDYNHDGFPGVKEAVDAAFGDRVKPATGRGWRRPHMSIWTVDLT